jgi:fluoroacetyl-CoA thioesterase
MKTHVKPGDKKEYRHTIDASDFASFHGELVHPVCSTFSLARDFEYSSRQFVLEMKEENEEGVGTFLTIEHKSPAFEGEEIVFTATIIKIQRNEITCAIMALAGDRVIAKGATGQKIIKKDNLKEIFRQL